MNPGSLRTAGGVGVTAFAVALLLLPAAGRATVSQYRGCEIALDSAPPALASADFNTDGTSDIAVVEQSDSQVMILLSNESSRALYSEGSCDRATTPSAVAVGPQSTAIEVLRDFNQIFVFFRRHRAQPSGMVVDVAQDFIGEEVHFLLAFAMNILPFCQSEDVG